MTNQFERTELLIGKDKLEILQKSHVAVFGIGGVGGYVVEALARSGIGALDLIDDDKVLIETGIGGVRILETPIADPVPRVC